MKGVVFTEFLRFVEESFDLAMVDHLITATKPASGGAYTAVGTYEASELLAMVMALSHKIEVPVPVLVKGFGKHLFKQFTISHAETMGHVTNTEQLLSSLEDRIHVDVRKLYPDAELPTLKFEKLSDKSSTLLYSSTRPLADLAEGLIESALEHFGEDVSIDRQDLPPGDGTKALFTLTQH